MDRFDSVNDTPNYQDSDKLNHTFDSQIGSMYNVSKALAEQDKKIEDYTGYTKGQIDDLLDTKANVDDVYTKTETDDLLSAKADVDDVYTKTETDDLLSAKANADDVYTKSETDDLLDAKANADDVYTKTETDNLLSAKADASQISPQNVNFVTSNSTFVGDGDIYYFTIGKLVIVNFSNINFKNVAQSNNDLLFSGLPQGKRDLIFILNGETQNVRVKFNGTTGEITNFYSSITPNANCHYGCSIAYLSK